MTELTPHWWTKTDSNAVTALTSHRLYEERAASGYREAICGLKATEWTENPTGTGSLCQVCREKGEGMTEAQS
jgi:hypothetical protein